MSLSFAKIEMTLFFHLLKDKSWNFTVKDEFPISDVYPHS